MELTIEQDPWIPEIIATCTVDYTEKKLQAEVKSILTEFKVDEDYYMDTVRDGGSLEIDIMNSKLLEEFKVLNK